MDARHIMHLINAKALYDTDWRSRQSTLNAVLDATLPGRSPIVSAMSPFASRLALAALVCACGGPATSTPKQTAKATQATAAKPVRGPLLWSVEKNGARSYVFALAPTGVDAAELPSLVWNTLDRSRALAISSDIRVLKRETLAPLWDNTGDDRLSVRLGESTWKRLIREMTAISRPKQLDRFAPSSAAYLLTRHGLPVNNLEDKLIDRARKQNKPVTLLDPQLKQSLALSRAKGIKQLRMVLLNLGAERDAVIERVQLYRAGDAGGLAHLVNDYVPADYDDPGALARYYRLPSTVWLDKMSDALRAGGLFIAHDIDEVLHRTGLLTGLRARGYTIRRMGIGKPATLTARAVWRMPLKDCRAYLQRMVRIRLRDNRPRGTVAPAEVAATMERVRPLVINRCVRWTKQQHTCYAAADDAQSLRACDRAPRVDLSSWQSPGGLKQVMLDACACKDNECARAVFASFVSVYHKVKHMNASPAEYKRVKEASRRTTRCLIARGIPGKEIVDAFQDSRK